MKEIKKIKNIKFNKKTIIGLSSLILVGGIVTSCNNFELNKEYEYIRTEYSSDGEYREFRQFKPFDQSNGENSFIYYSNWELREDGKYQREVKEYNIKAKSYEDLKNIKNENDIDAVLGKPEKSYIQVSNTLSDEDISRESHYEIVIYSKNENKYVSIKEPTKNITALVACGIGIVIAVGSLIAWKKYDDAISDKKDKKESKKLTLKRDN